MEFDCDKMYCGAIRRGDIFLYEDDAGRAKIVVILQDNILNEGLPTVVCALLKPCKPNEEVFANEVLLRKNEIGLRTDGICLLHKIFTVDRRSLTIKKAELQKETLEKIYQALDINLGRFRD